MTKFRVADKSRRTYRGIVLDSMAEKDRFVELSMLEQDGQIAGLKVHPEFLLQPSFTHDGVNYRKIV
jgi:hypothetical protein